MGKGSLALILHAHLPFVRHPEHEEFFEESWLFEAITETYIPLLGMMQRLVDDRVPFRIAMSITPPLCAMLQDELLRERYVQHLGRSIDLAQRELERHGGHAELHELARFYRDLLIDTRQRFETCHRDLLSVFRRLRDAGVLEIVASAATHGLLPLLAQSPQAVRAQVLIGCDVYRQTFEAEPAGFWLPECAFAPGIEKVLQETNIRWFVVDAHGLLLAKPRPRAAIYAPCFTPAGPAAFARDPASSRQVWSAQSGYPGDPAYRDFYRDVGFDSPPHHAFAHSCDKTPRFTGLKYHRVTGGEGPKQIYQREWAEQVAEVHAGHFLDSRRQQLEDLQSSVNNPLIVVPFDAELFGHWWYEGPRFLELFIRKAAAEDAVRLTTPSDYLAAHPRLQVVTPAASSWGENGYWEVWLQEKNAWIYPRLHSAARKMSEVARANAATATPVVERALRQLARELLLAQSSDWAFVMKTGTANEYATRRVEDHLSRFETLYRQLRSGKIDEAFLSERESRDNLFPHVDWRHYL